MTTRLVVLPQRCETHYAPLAVLGYCLTRTDFLVPLAAVELGIKTVEHLPVVAFGRLPLAVDARVLTAVLALRKIGVPQPDVSTALA